MLANTCCLWRHSRRLGAPGQPAGLQVDSPYHAVLMVSGTVSSWAEHHDALAAAWSAPGVTAVDDRIVVIY